MITYSSAAAAADVIKLYKPDFTPKIGMILGSGLGDIAEKIQDSTIVPYFKLPGFHHCSVAGHKGNLHLGKIGEVSVACLQGRAHFYEGISPIVIRTLIRTMKLIGCEFIIITCASGSLRPNVSPGSLLLVTDHINFQGTNPMLGPNDEEFGSRFFSMENAYDLELRQQCLQVADQLNIKLEQGVYVAVSGPCFETPAEIRAYRTLGADAVGMSLVPEVIVARHCGLKVLAISAVTNLAAGLSAEFLTHEQTLKGAKLAAANLSALLTTFIEKNT